MVDDFYNPEEPETDCHSCDLAGLTHEFIEFFVDPGSKELSASRASLLFMNLIGGVLASVLVVCGVLFNMSWTGIPAATIVTGLVASDATVYFASTRKDYRCNRREGDGD